MGGWCNSIAKDSKIKRWLDECVASKTFRDLKQVASIGEILLGMGFGVVLWYVCKTMYPMYFLLRLAYMRIGGIDNVKYNMNQIDCLLQESVAEVIEKWQTDSCPPLKLKMASDADYDFDLPKTIGGLKTVVLDEGAVFVFVGFYSSL